MRHSHFGLSLFTKAQLGGNSIQQTREIEIRRLLDYQY